ncbi:ABC transporter ATP-binding protein [Cylindrospermopsis curvispora]|uniref:ABC transporter ATP-binding protein n=1 Tax=Cylindrospermopsis curvispora GIHE-G1 TaxID=2666332 RepID=A0A7H0F1N6_9CYAN|nr:ABC transporter ATP-binding protein [Cylindrospermopsis curvispora]QNP29952.1 ABC transporter ATP-binding protein [Cylindrospermopsis curvispora GIHE-G1]
MIPIKKILLRSLPRYNTPAYRTIATTMNRNRSLVVFTFVSNLLSATLETATLGIIFLALGVLQDNQLPQLPDTIKSALPWLADRWKGENQEVFLLLIGLAVLSQVVRSLMTYISLVSSGDLTARVQAQMTEKVFARIMSFTFSCASRYKIGDLSTYVGQAGSTVDMQMRLWSGFLTGIMMFFAYSITVLTISLPLSAVAILLFVLLIWLQRYLIPRIQSTARELSQAQVDVAKDMVENIQGLRVVHTFGYQHSTINRVVYLQKQVLVFLQRQARLLSITSPLNNALTIFVIAALLLTGSFLLQRGQGNVLPALATFILALNRLSMQVQGLAGTMNGLAENSGRMDRLDAILGGEGQEFSRVGGEIFKGLKSAITFNHVSLKYEGTSLPALSDICFKLPRNRVVALIGSSGAGKSSVADLLIGLYAPTTGEILVDGLNLQSYSWESWRSKLGVVSQDTFIFNQSILENIRYGMTNATDEQVLEAARVAQADQFIQLLPKGYETVVGERGYRLSGGQRQRVALARAILKQPEILILDEATSALDSESERLVQQALGQFQAERTVLVIAHRLSTIVNADEILVMEQGCIVERGTHQELLELGSKYANYWQMQSAH